LIRNRETGKEEKIETNLLIIATGLIPETCLAKKTGCKIGKNNHIIINEKSETSINMIYAVGDCTEYKDFVTKEKIPIGLGSIAVRQGIAAGINSAGGNYNLPDGILHTCTSKIFDLEIAAVGPISNYLKNYSLITARFNGLSLPEYFPGGKPIIIKILVDEKTDKILGAQAIGNNSAQRINTIACAILSGMSVEKLKKLETAYAPPVAPTLDAVTVVCDIVSKKINRKRR
jgi:NADH oxidase (H2O2-forming)